jgi:MFS family permease
MNAAAPPLRRRGFAHVAEALALERNTASVVGAMFLMALGENLWRRFIPKYLEALGAPVVAIGAYGSTEDLLDGLYQYPGGWVGDRHGRRRAMLLFVSLAAIGYLIVAAAPAWPVVLLGLVFVMCWTSMASPTLFAVVGDALPRERRAVGFSVQAILRRVPIVVAPTLGGLLIVTLAAGCGSLIVSIALAGHAAGGAPDAATSPHPPRGNRRIWRRCHRAATAAALRRFIRTCDGMVDVFLVLYAVKWWESGRRRSGPGASPDRHRNLARSPRASPTGWASRSWRPSRVHRFSRPWSRPMVPGLVLAFVVGGLREIGEPARKALILEFVPPEMRARGVGLYYLIRSLAIAPAATVGGVLWNVTPQSPFLMAGAIGLAGTVLFVLTVEERHAG